MASLNLSANGPSIAKSYQSIVNAPPASGSTGSSPTCGQWAVYSVSTPLVNAFQQDSGGKEAVLKVQSTGEGELADLIEEFSDGKVQFAFVKVKDSNSGLPKHVYIGWCGEGVPERTKGYFANYQQAAAKLLHGYHVQITARSERDLTPESIIQQVAKASGSNYSRTSASQATGRPPPVTSKPAFMPTSSTSGSYNASGTRRMGSKGTENTDADGWGNDAPPVTRTQLERVSAAYQPTKVNMKDLSSQQQSSNFQAPVSQDRPDIVKGAYQPIGKVDIAAIRRQAQDSGRVQEDRPTTVKGSYEPVGKVDIAAIRARAQQPSNTVSSSALPAEEDSAPKPLIERSAPFNQSERLTELPKPKVGNKFGSNVSSFTGTKAPLPGAFGQESQKSPTSVQVGAGRTFADQAGKTPAQLWAEKKARQGGSMPQAIPSGIESSGADQSGSGWKSGYAGKSWAAVQTTKTGQSASSLEDQRTGEQTEHQEEETPISGGVSGIRDRFKDVKISGHDTNNYSPPEPPRLETSTKPNASRGIPIPGLSQESDSRVSQPPAQPRSPTPPTPKIPDSPIRVAVPVSRNVPEIEDAHDEQFSPPSALPAAPTVTATTLTQTAAPSSSTPTASQGGRTAIAQYDYERAEDNELELREGERIVKIDMVDEDWWSGENSRGEVGLFPSNYVELVEDDHAAAHAATPAPLARASESNPTIAPSATATATALYDYEAGEDNELTFPEGAKITNVEFPDEDWWSGEYDGHAGLFPASYVSLDK